MSETKQGNKNNVKNGNSRPLTPPANEEIPFADEESNEDLIKGVEGEWMTTPASPIDCPRGLEYLTTLDKLFVEEEVKLIELLTVFGEASKYVVRNEVGQNVYYAVEVTECLQNFCGPIRPFEMKILNSSAEEVISMNRPLRCMTCWCPCFLQEMEVSAPPGTKIGTVKQNWSINRTKYSVHDAEGKKVLSIYGPCCGWKCCRCQCCHCDIHFKVYDTHGNKVGEITKKWTNVAKELFTTSDLFGISFPKELDVKMKAVLLGACFLIDFMFFETPVQEKQVEKFIEKNAKK